MNKFYFFVTLSILIIILGISIDGTHANNKEPIKTNYVPPTETQMFYKTIDVKITDIKQTWSDNRLRTWSVKVISEEYGLDGSFNVNFSSMGNDQYGYDLFYGKLKVGDIIHAELLSWITNGNVDRRAISRLVK